MRAPRPMQVLERRAVLHEDLRQLPGPRRGCDQEPPHARYRRPGTDGDSGTPGYQTELPILTWDPVPGASSYQVNVVPRFVFDAGVGGFICNWGATTGKWLVSTSSTSWTPLGSGSTATPPPRRPSAFQRTRPASSRARTYCARVHARSGRARSPSPTAIYGDYVSGRRHRRLVHVHVLPGRWCTPLTGLQRWLPRHRRLSLADLVARQSAPTPCWCGTRSQAGTLTGFLSRRIRRSQTSSDYAFSAFRLTRRALGGTPRPYDDETTSYYWVVLPRRQVRMAWAPRQPVPGAWISRSNRLHRHWSPPIQVRASLVSRRFALEPDARSQGVSPPGRDRADVRLSLDDVKTASTEFTALKTYDAAKTLYWRVQADVENPTSAGQGLTWSDWGTFQISLPKPVLDPATPTIGDSSLPVLRWFPRRGRSLLQLRIHEPNDNTPNTYSGFPSTAASFSKITGKGSSRGSSSGLPKTTGTTPALV